MATPISFSSEVPGAGIHSEAADGPRLPLALAAAAKPRGEQGKASQSLEMALRSDAATVSAEMDGQGLSVSKTPTTSNGVNSRRYVSFHTNEKEVREYTPPSISVGSIETLERPRRCCLIQLCLELAESVRERPREEEEMFHDDFDAATAEWQHSRTAFDGYLWKLGSSRRDEDWSDVTCWRRRQFYLQRQEDRLALMYTSEKENGVLQVSCMLASRDARGKPKTAATVQALRGVSSKALQEDEKQRTVGDLRIYDTAIGQKRYDYDYERDLPAEFHPFDIQWFNDEGKPERIVLSGGNQRTSERWVSALTKALQHMARIHQRPLGGEQRPRRRP